MAFIFFDIINKRKKKIWTFPVFSYFPTPSYQVSFFLSVQLNKKKKKQKIKTTLSAHQINKKLASQEAIS